MADFTSGLVFKNVRISFSELWRERQEEIEHDREEAEKNCEHADREFDERRLNGK